MSLRDLYLQYATALRPFMRLAPILGGVAVLLWRVRETRVPVTARSLIIPPLGMSTGLGMFFVPAARVPWSWAIASLLFGALVFMAFGMIVVWRVMLFLSYRRVTADTIPFR